MYTAKLTKEEAEAFTSLFNELEVAKVCKITTKPRNEMVVMVSIEPKSGDLAQFSYLLDESFKDGQLAPWRDPFTSQK